MRNLTIKRTKSIVACLKKLSVYIEDPTASELDITGVQCRKIGELKNGEEKTFQIEESAAKVFVIADKLSKDFCNDFYQLPEGKEDLFLSGRNKYSLGAANAFRFDNNNNAEAIANRKRTATKIVPVVVGIILGIGLYFGTTNAHRLFPTPQPQDKTFAYQEMNITLTDEFQEHERGENMFAYSSDEVAVFVLKEPFTLMDGSEDITVEEYGEMVLYANGYSIDKLKITDGLVSFEYTHQEEDVVLWYYSVAYKADNAFWLVQFVAPKDSAPDYEAQFITWAKTVNFSSAEGVV